MPWTREGAKALNAIATHPLATAVYVYRCATDDCIHLYLADEGGIVIAEAIMIAPIAEKIAGDILHYAAEHRGELQ